MINGVLNIYKEKGFTSHDVVAKLRGILKQKKIGHTGTLDPDAQGVLLVCVGKATKLCDMLTDKDKTYVAELLLGVETDTQDTTGAVLASKPVECSLEQIRETIQGFVGGYEQIPPMYSALKVNGKKLYELARQGVEVERKPRKVQIHSIKILEEKLPIIKMEVSCSKGTYIRTLCHDIGQRLVCGGCMDSLLRTKVERFLLEDSVRLQEVEEAIVQNALSNILLPIDKMFEALPKVDVKPEFSKLVYNGNRFAREHCEEEGNIEGRLRVYDSLGEFVGIYEWKEDAHMYEPVKIFLEAK